MGTQDENIALFLNAISENLEIRRKEIEAEIAAVRKAEHDKAELEASARSEAYIQAETKKILSRLNRDRSALETGLRRELAETRAGIADKVFAAVAEKLKDFSKTPAYAKFLENSAVRIKAACGENKMTIFIRTADLPHKDIILAAAGAGCRVDTDDSIRLGGCKAKAEGSNISLDDTLDARLQAQRPVFYERSGLSVEAI
jgi:V/A-type H+/Na+-transporting ATPase subunit E